MDIPARIPRRGERRPPAMARPSFHREPDVPLVAHRNRLRLFELTNGRAHIELDAELMSAGAVNPLPFVRDARGIRPADATLLAMVGDTDVTGSLRRSRRWIVLRDRRTDAEIWIAADIRVESTPDHGRLRQFAVRFGGRVDFDVLASVADRASSGTWDAFSVLDTLGEQTMAPIGAHRDRGAVDTRLRPSVVNGRKIEPVLTGFGPRLTLRISKA
jgi:hypothetical protein